MHEKHARIEATLNALKEGCEVEVASAEVNVYEAAASTHTLYQTAYYFNTEFISINMKWSKL